MSQGGIVDSVARLPSETIRAERETIYPMTFRELRINYQIDVPSIRLMDEKNDLGVVRTKRAIEMAEERHVDLVEVVPRATPPVCRLMDYERYRSDALVRDEEDPGQPPISG